MRYLSVESAELVLQMMTACVTARNSSPTREERTGENECETITYPPRVSGGDLTSLGALWPRAIKF